MKNDKNDTIDLILNNVMDVIFSLPFDPKSSVRYAISACLRFATRAAIRLHITPEELLKELQEEWMWNEDEIRNNGSNNSGVLN